MPTTSVSTRLRMRSLSVLMVSTLDTLSVVRVRQCRHQQRLAELAAPVALAALVIHLPLLDVRSIIQSLPTVTHATAPMVTMLLVRMGIIRERKVAHGLLMCWGRPRQRPAICLAIPCGVG